MLTLTLAASCSDYLDKAPDDQLTMDMIFSDKTRTEDWLASVFFGIPDPGWGYYKDQGYSIMGDDITIPPEWQPFGWANVYAYTTANWSPISAWNPYYWVELPKRIRTGLIYLEQVRVIPEINLTEAYVERTKNEVRALIAYFYSIMIEIYGPIPFNPGVIVPVSSSAADLMTPQQPYDKIVDWIDQELLEVSNNLPAVYTDNNDWGHVTSIMALAIRAKTLLFAASPLFNGNPDLRNWKNSEGEALFDPAFQPSKWERAAKAHELLIQKAEAAGYGLYEEKNGDGTLDPFMSYYNMQFKRWMDGNKELVFVRPVGLANAQGDDQTNGWQAHHLPIGIGGNGAMGTTQELVDAFFMANGEVPITGYNADGSPIINPESGYSEKGFSDAADLRHTRWPGGGPASLGNPDTDMNPVTMEGTFNMYVNREPRFYVSVIYNKAWLGVANRQANFLQGGLDTNLTFDSPQNGYDVRKLIPLDVYPRENRYTYQPRILYRMADAYLGYAEALNESLAQPNATVYQYVNKIRTRAGIPDLKPGLNKEQMRLAIQRERRVEFNCEGIRFHDVRRWLQGEQFFNVRMYGMNHPGWLQSDDPNEPGAYYVRTYLKQRSFNKRMYLWPVPQAQMDINPNLVQAPGY
jgi:hypothetical protein